MSAKLPRGMRWLTYTLLGVGALLVLLTVVAIAPTTSGALLVVYPTAVAVIYAAVAAVLWLIVAAVVSRLHRS